MNCGVAFNVAMCWSVARPIVNSFGLPTRSGPFWETPSQLRIGTPPACGRHVEYPIRSHCPPAGNFWNECSAIYRPQTPAAQTNMKHKDTKAQRHQERPQTKILDAAFLG